MEERKIITERFEISIGNASPFPQPITFKSIKESKGLADSDIVLGVATRLGEHEGFGQDDEDATYYYSVVIIERNRPETDKEYLNRLKKQEQIKAQVEEKEKLEYLRLKAKFENEKL